MSKITIIDFSRLIMIKNDTIQQVVLGRLQSPYTEFRNIYKNLKTKRL
ncbi:MAG: hypothetical protein BWY22_01683 [Bacteroidetes bacterium ADurb.Bin217]|nr:MAG: hypothetical protein BWY22_01683 [Bacteroidetes bacterium ADurb.Bin217]